MRTTIDIPDDLFRACKAAAALEGGTLKELVTEALRSYLERRGEAVPARRGWRSVFGSASREDVAEIEAIIEADLGQVDPEEWR